MPLPDMANARLPEPFSSVPLKFAMSDGSTVKRAGVAQLSTVPLPVNPPVVTSCVFRFSVALDAISNVPDPKAEVLSAVIAPLVIVVPPV